MQLNKFIVFPSDYAPLVSQSDTESLFKMQQELLEDYVSHKDSQSFEEWLEETLKKRIANADRLVIKQETTIIIDTLKKCDEKERARNIYNANGLNDSEWMCQELTKQTKNMSPEQTQLFLEHTAQQLDESNRIKLNVSNAAQSLLTHAKEGETAEKLLPSLQIGACAMVERFNRESETKLLGYKAVLDETAVSAKLPYGMIKIYKDDKQVDAFGVLYLPYKGPLIEGNGEHSIKRLALLNTPRNAANCLTNSSQVAVCSNAKALNAVLGFDKVEAQCLIDELKKQIGFEEVPDFEFTDIAFEDVPEYEESVESSSQLSKETGTSLVSTKPNLARIGCKLKLADHEDIGVFNDLPKASSIAKALEKLDEQDFGTQEANFSETDAQFYQEDSVEKLAVIPLPEDTVITEDVTEREPIADYYDRPADPEFVEHLNQQSWFKSSYATNPVLSCLGGRPIPYETWNDQVKQDRIKEIVEALKNSEILDSYIYPALSMAKNVLVTGFKLTDKCVNFVFDALTTGATLALKSITTLAIAFTSGVFFGFQNVDFVKAAVMADNCVRTLGKAMDIAAQHMKVLAQKGLYLAGKATGEVLASKAASIIVGAILGANLGPVGTIVGCMLGLALSSAADVIFDKAVVKVVKQTADYKNKVLNNLRNAEGKKAANLDTNKTTVQQTNKQTIFQ